jgi:hypothetical protein
MPESPKAGVLLRLFRDVGAKPYPVTAGRAQTSKVARCVLPNAVPVVIEMDRKTPNVWLLPEHERGALRLVGKSQHYEAGRGRHHHLEQVREFVGRGLLKVPVTSDSWPDISNAIKAVCGSR